MRVVRVRKAQSPARERMHFRLAAEIKERVTRAAAIAGQGLTDFAVSALSERADEILDRHGTVLLSRKDYDFFLRSLDDDKKPSRRSRAAAARYKGGGRKGVRHRLAG